MWVYGARGGKEREIEGCYEEEEEEGPWIYRHYNKYAIQNIPMKGTQRKVVFELREGQ